MSQVQRAIDQICRARRYTEGLLNHTDMSQWFRQPSDGVTHVAWQVGHLAVAQYGLALRRVRGELPEDVELLPGEFRDCFGKGSVPKSDANAYPKATVIRDTFERVHRKVVEQLNGLTDEIVDQPVEPPAHPMFRTKLGALEFCAQHEFIHAGQIALLRRLLGQEPLR